MKWKCGMICLVALVLYAPSQRTPAPVIGEVAYRFGDQHLWSSPNHDDEQWERMHWFGLRFHKEVLWIRTWVDVPAFETERPWGLYLSGLFSAEVFWDGKKIGQKGKPGNHATSEIPGPIDTVIYLPSGNLETGRHLLAIRISGHHQQEEIYRPFHTLAMAEFRHYRLRIMEHYVPALMTLSALLLGAIYFAGRFVRNRKEKSLLWLVWLCIVIAIQLLAESWRGFVSYTYNVHLWRLWLIAACAFFEGVALVAYLGSRLRFPKTWRWIGLGSLVSVGIWPWIKGYDGTTLLIYATFLSIASFLAVKAYWQKRRDAGLVLLGILILTCGVFLSAPLFLDRFLYISFLLFLVVLFIVEIQALSRIEKARWTAESSMQRLELELIKKQIQPHFLMNTLTSLAEWFDAEPQTASAMVESIADVYRLLLEVASQRLIPMEKELQLCHAYLKVMGYRRDHPYHLETEGSLSGDRTPPAVLLTLVENAMTHNAYGSDGATFELRVEQADRTHPWRMTFAVPLVQTEDEDLLDVETKHGTGAAYVQARLLEAYGNDWSLMDGETEDGTWRTVIEVWAE